MLNEKLRRPKMSGGRLLSGRVRFVPDLKLRDNPRCRQMARKIAGELADVRADDGGKYCFSLDIEQADMLQNRAQICFPTIRYGAERERHGTSEIASYASIRTDLWVSRYCVGNVLTQNCTNRALSDALRHYGEKVSGTKEEMIERMQKLVARLYPDCEGRMDRYFRGGFIRVDHRKDNASGKWFEPDVDSGPLRNTIIAVYVLKHLRGDRILSADWENEAYSVEELAGAVLEGRVSVRGVFVRAV